MKRADRLLASAAAILLACAPAAAAAGGEPSGLRPALLEVSVNGQARADPQLMLVDAEGRIYASEEALRLWRLRRPAGEPLLFEGAAYFPLEALPALKTSLSEAEQRLAIEAPARLFEEQETALHRPDAMAMTRPGTGAFVNYDLFAEHARAGSSLSGFAELGFFSAAGVATGSFVGHAGPGESHLRRLETSWTIDRPDSMSSIRIGDAITRGGPLAPPVRFGGIQIARNFAVQPGFLTMPLPTLEGSAAVPSVVDIYVNNALQGRREVAPGPFRIHEVPVQAGAGQVQIVVHDMLGREVATTHSYYASSQMLRRGLHDYSYEIGFVRREFGRSSNSYGALMAATTQRLGLSDTVTAEANLQIAEEAQLGAMGLIAGLGDFGLVNLTAALSRSDRGTGHSAAAAFERRTRGLSVGARGEYNSPNFAFPGEANGPALPRLAGQLFVDVPFDGGAIGFNIVHRDRIDGPDETVAGAFATLSVRNFGAIQLFARYGAAGRKQTVVGANFAIAIGGRRSASAGVEIDNGSTSATISYQNNPPPGVGSGYRVQAAAGRHERAEAVYIHNAERATFSLQAAHFEGENGVRASMAGAVGLNGGRLFASRALGQSFATVKVGDHAGIRVYADNQLIGATDARGELVVPALRPWERNLIRIDDADFPMDVQLGQSEVAVRPFARAGVTVTFTPRRERGATVRILTAEGAPLPAGALVFVDGGSEGFVVAPGGETYLTGLAGRSALRAQWAGGSCRATVTMPDNDDPQPRLGDAVCERELDYAGG